VKIERVLTGQTCYYLKLRLSSQIQAKAELDSRKLLRREHFDTAVGEVLP